MDGASLTTVLRLTACTIDLTERSIQRVDGVGRLTPTEARLLARLAQAPGRMVLREILQQDVWGHAKGVLSRTVDVTVRRLRKKIEANPAEPRHLLTIHGNGYVLHVDVDEAGDIQDGARFMGRDGELAALGALAARRGLVTVTGPPGVGKTRLVREWIRRQPGVIPVVRLADATDLDGVVRRMARALGLPLGPGAPAAHAVQVCAALGARGVERLVLDSVEQALDGILPVLEAWTDDPAAPGLVLTSQRATGVAGEGILRLRGLDVPAAVALYEARAQAAGAILSTEDGPSAAELARRFDGLPLAMELLGARAPILPASRVLRRMQDRFQVAARPRAGRGRSRSLAGALAWSWDLLDPHQRRALQACAMFQGAFAVELGEAALTGALGDDAPTPLDLLEELQRRSLLEAVGGGRLRVSENLRAYARLRAEADAALQDLQARHRACALAAADPLAQSWGGLDLVDRVDALGELVEDLLAARVGASPADQVRLALALHLPLRHRGPRDLHLDVMVGAWTEARGAASPEERGRLGLCAAEALRVRGRGAEALAVLEEVHGLASAGAPPAVVARAAAQASYVAHLAGKNHDAKAWQERADAAGAGLDDMGATVAVALFAGVVAANQGRVDAALDRLAPAADWIRHQPDQEFAAALYSVQSVAFLMAGDMDGALDALELALEADGAALGSQRGALALQRAAMMRVRGDLEACLAACRAAARDYAELGQRPSVLAAELEAGWVLMEMGRLEEGEAAVRQVRRDAARGGWTHAQACGAVGVAYVLAGDGSRASGCLEAALRGLDSLDSTHDGEWFLPWLWLSQALSGDPAAPTEAPRLTQPGPQELARLAGGALAVVAADQAAARQILAAPGFSLTNGLEHVRLMRRWITDRLGD